MMDAFEAITTRRSVRHLEPAPVSDDLLRDLVAAGMSGPTAGNQRPWRFLVLNDRDRLDAAATVPGYKALANVSAAIVVCADMDLCKFGDNWIIDCAIAAQNILLAVHAAGFAAVWLSCYYMDERFAALKKALDLPEHITPFMVVPIGKTQETPVAAERYQPERVHMNSW